MRRASALLVGGLLVVAAGIPAFGAAPSKKAPALKAGDLYVSLGSSIASGFGISVQSPEGGCGRSSRDWGQLVAAKLKLELVDVSCGGAQVKHVVDTPQGANPPQITAVTPDTKLITVAVGGNDIGYNGTALGCGNPATVCSAPATLETDLTTLKSTLPDMLDKLEEAAPNARIVFVTYPREMPRTKNCDALSYTDEEYQLVQSMGQKLEAVFLDVVAKRKGVIFVDPYAAKGDHTACAGASKAWTAGFVADDGFAYHPTALGHEVVTKMIIKALKKH